MFMICVAANNQESLENVARWRDEIKEREPTKPIALFRTKDDLSLSINDPVDVVMIRHKQ